MLAIGPDVGADLARQLSADGEPDRTDSVDATHAHVDNSPLLQASLQVLTSRSVYDHPHRDALLELNVTQLLLHLLQTAARPLLLRADDSVPNPPGLAAAVRHVHRHLHRPLSVDELAEQACMSRSSFYRHFRAAFGLTPLQYVTRMRIEHAQALLRDPARTVTDVSLDLGFRSVSHFIDRFRRQVGTTPSVYQRSFRTTDEC
jgi:AraC-like DNA-binding protein